jgi:sarcosine oxidase
MRAVVVGSGVMGAWTALWLRRGGHDVTLVDRHGPGNRLGSSGDASRITRSSHGADRHYPVWQRRALAHWQALEATAEEQLFVPAGVVWLASEAQSFEAESLMALEELGIPVERWSHDELATRVPVLNADGVPWALYEPEGGALLARTGVLATIARFEAEGGNVIIGRVAPPEGAPDSSDHSNGSRTGGRPRGTNNGGGPRAGAPGDPASRGALERIELEDGQTLEADGFVFACGPWLPDLFPSTIGGLITPHRQDVMHFAVPSGDRRYDADRMPVWIDFEGSFYGFPSFDGLSMKACPDWLGPIERCDESARECADSTVEASRAVLRRRFPEVAGQPVVHTWTCFYEVTPDAHFVIDRHPSLADTWIAGGGTGHGFKHGPVIGEYMASLVSGDTATSAALAPPDDRFTIHDRAATPGFRTSGRNPLEV